MKDCPVFNLVAVPHKDMSTACRVFNTSEIDYHLFVKVPVDIAKNCVLYQVAEVADKISMCGPDMWEHDIGRIWYKFISHKLNMIAGHHVYRLSFVNYRTNDTIQLYMSYIIQDNNPAKPYYYMEEARKFLDEETNNS